MLSTPEKSRPNSMFNRTFEGAVAGKNNWTPLFLPWQCRPGRTQPWYDQELASQTYNRGNRAGSCLPAKLATSSPLSMPWLKYKPCFLRTGG